MPFKIIISLLLTTTFSYASMQKDSAKIYSRITSVQPSKAEIQQMSSMLQSGQKREVIKYALDSKFFYNLRLKSWVKGWTNEEESNRVELNDYVATVIGLIRDDKPFNTVLWEDVVYTGRAGLANVAAYATDNNEHYADLEKEGVDLKADLVARVQSTLNGISDSAGVMTTRAAGASFLSAGTNRALTRYMFMTYLCKDFEELHDTNIPDFRVRRDVDRAPGGDSRTFKNKCVGCHAGQDALGGAFAYFDFVDNEVVYTPGTVSSKVNANVLYPTGHVVQNDSWMNLWSQGQNATLGWRASNTGNGAKSFGRLLGTSKQFSRCMVEKSYELICLNPVESKLQQGDIDTLVNSFENEYNYNMKELMADVGLLCL